MIRTLIYIAWRIWAWRNHVCPKHFLQRPGIHDGEGIVWGCCTQCVVSANIKDEQRQLKKIASITLFKALLSPTKEG